MALLFRGLRLDVDELKRAAYKLQDDDVALHSTAWRLCRLAQAR